MNLALNTSTTVFIEKEKGLEPELKEKLVQTGKVSFKARPASPQIAYQTHPQFIQFLFNATIIPLIDDLRKLNIVKKVFSPEELQTIRDTVAQSRFYTLLKGVAENSIALRIETIQLTILQINTMSKGTDGSPRFSPDTFLASIAVEYCVKRLIKSTVNETDNIWNSEEGKQFFVGLSLLNEQYYNCGFTTPIDLLIYKLETAAYLDPNLQKFITSTTYPLYESIMKKLYKHRAHIDNKTQKKIIKIAGKYFSDSLRTAYFLFKLGLDDSLQNLNENLRCARLFRKNTIATAHVMKRAERMKHLNFLNLKEIPEGHVIDRKNIVIEEGEHILTLARETTTNRVKVITLTQKNRENIDVYLFAQKVKDPHDVPDSQNKMCLLKFSVTPGTNLIWLKKADDAVTKAVTEQFTVNQYDRSIYPVIKFKNELILVEIFKQLGMSLNSRTRAGTIDTFEETLTKYAESGNLTLKNKPQYDDEFKEELHQVLEFSLGSPISNYLTKCYHNTDLDRDSHDRTATNKRKFQESWAKLSIAHIEKEAGRGRRRNKDAYKWVKKSILAAGVDDPKKPVDVGNDAPSFKVAEKINLEFWHEPLKAQLKKNSHTILLGIAEIISASVLSAFSAHTNNADIIKMLKDNFSTEKLDDVFKEADTAKRVALIFKKLLVEWKLKCTNGQLSLFSKFFKVDFPHSKKKRLTAKKTTRTTKKSSVRTGVVPSRSGKKLRIRSLRPEVNSTL